MGNPLLHRLEPFKYSLLLISSVAIIFSLPVPSGSKAYELFYATIMSFNILAGLVVVSSGKGFRNLIIKLLGISLIALLFIELLTPIPLFESILGILFVVFFVSISVRVYKDIFKAEKIGREILAAVFCGYIFIGFLASFLFMAIEGLAPGSFSGIVQDITRFDNFLYFSFISLLTIGYGDMVPLTSLTKSLVVVLGLIGNFYTVFVTAIIVGKFLMNYNKSS